jgi:hypothetical protein
MPGGSTGLLVKDYKGKESSKAVYKVDTGLLAKLRGHERQTVEKLKRWKTHHEERKVIDASPAAITLALLLTDEELDSLEKSAGDGEIAGADYQVDRMSQALNRLRAMESPPKSSPPMPWPPTATAVGWRDRRESDPRRGRRRRRWATEPQQILSAGTWI